MLDGSESQLHSLSDYVEGAIMLAINQRELGRVERCYMLHLNTLILYTYSTNNQPVFFNTPGI